MKTKLTVKKLIAARNLLAGNEDKKLLKRKGRLNRIITAAVSKQNTSLQKL